MAQVYTHSESLGASQEHAIDIEDNIEDTRESSSDLDATAISAMNQLDHGFDNSAISFNEDDSADPLGEELRPASNESESASEICMALYEDIVNRDGIAVIVPPVQNPWEYRKYEEPSTAIAILEEYDDAGLVEYLVQFDDESEEVMTFDAVLGLDNGNTILADFNEHQSDDQSEESDPAPKRKSRRSRNLQDKHISNISLSSDDELTSAKASRPTRTRGRPSMGKSSRSQQTETASSENSECGSYRRKPTRPLSTRATRAGAQKHVNYSDILLMDDLLSDDSSDALQFGKRKRTTQPSTVPSKTRRLLRGPERRRKRTSSSPDEGVRRSGRTLGQRNMREYGEDDIPETRATATAAIKYVGAKETFKELPEYDDFRLRHCQTCQTCYEIGDNEAKGRLIYCQGCTIAYHQKCLGSRNGREHLVTKVAEKDFVLQCRRCIGLPKQKDPTAPDQGLCLSCHEPGSSTSAFRERNTSREEQKQREDNGGEDPITYVLPDLINDADTLLFRCLICFRGCHLYHLPSKQHSACPSDMNEVQLASLRFEEYSQTWSCKDCADAPADIDLLVAWRPTNVDSYEPGMTTEMVEGSAQDYLVKWKKMPYVNVKWMPGDWIWGIAAPAMRKAFFKRDNLSSLRKMTTEEAVPEDFMRVDIVFDVQYTNVVKQPSEKVAKARIKEVKKAYVKYKGLGYEDVVWAEPPRQEEIERWADFQAAYEDWVMGTFIRQPSKKNLEVRLKHVRSESFKDSLALNKQPDCLVGGELMKYQMDGLNWLYYQWYQQQNAILADEMGLGKTIQVIGFLATLKEAHGCWPFLVVVPNSTCPNWRREIKRWVPSLRVVTYYGSAEARKLAAKHELFPSESKDLRCHIVVASYDSAQDDEFRKVFRGVRWAGLVVDEGQRLKSDKNILYSALNALKAPFKLLLTGTPLQNNARELFNLLQFLDDSFNAQQMEEDYATLTEENILRLHTQLRGLFLRRTKAEVLTFLPSMAQIIIPVSMSVLQKKLYKSILAQNPELIRSIVGSSKALGPKERTNLNNILMQLRKCLAHPFVYSRSIEERTSNPTKSHRNLVDASSKLQLLELMLPKLQERGHRVLIFSQFLDMLNMIEDFLDGVGLSYERLDGSMGSLQKQKRIDEFNTPNSDLFAFLLSTRAGGVGINLATADTVIILDPDFNPHQDIQALSRAHRIGQKKKVLVFQLTTRATAEEKIMQIGKKKMALDHIMIEKMDAPDDAGMDLESILKHGTDALFKDDDTLDIKYDSASVDRLLDRSQVEDTEIDKDKSAESQFSFARVWANDKGTLEQGMENSEDHEPDPSIWDAILKEREREAAEEAAKRAEDLGRGRRKRQTVDYTRQIDQGPTSSPGNRGRRSRDSDSDTDFMEHGDEGDDATVAADSGVEDNKEVEQLVESQEPASRRQSSTSLSQPSPTDSKGSRVRRASASQALPKPPKGPKFKRAAVPPVTANGLPLPPANDRVVPSPSQPTANGFASHASHQQGSSDQPIELGDDSNVPVHCIACNNVHVEGYCPLKLARVEHCGLCGLPHYGHARTCPHLGSITQLRAMLEALKQSTEPREVRELAKKKITGILGDINQRRRRAKEIQDRKNAVNNSLNGQNGHGVNGNVMDNHISVSP